MEVSGEIHFLAALQLGKLPQYLLCWRVDPRAGPDVSEKRVKSCLYRFWNIKTVHGDLINFILCIPCCVFNLRDRDHLQELDVDGRIILNWIFKKMWDGSWTGLICWTGGGLLRLL